MLIGLCLLIPLIGGLALFFIKPESLKHRLIYTMSVVTVTSVLVWFVLLTRQGTHISLFTIMEGLTLCFRVDGMSSVFCALISILWPIATLYGMEYMEHEQRRNSFFAFYTMSYAATLAVALSGSLFTLYIFYECLTLITFPLVLHKRDHASAKAGRKYLAFSISGAAMAFMALIALIHFSGDTDFVLGGILKGNYEPNTIRLLRFMFLMAFIGFGTKAAVFPMYAWLPSASVAPTPVTALLHAVAVVNSGVFAVLRSIYYSFGTEILSGSNVQTITILISAFTIIFGSAMAVKEQHFKRRLAYSTVSNLSYMLIGATLMTPAGMVGSLTHLVAHGLMKITLFYCAGAVLVRSGKEYVQDLRGYHTIMPVTCAIYTLSAVAMVGIPPLCGFVSKWNLLTAAGALNNWTGIVVICTLIISSVLTAVYLLGPATAMYFRPLNPGIAGDKKDPGLLMTIPFIILTVMIIALGVYSEPLVSFLRTVSGQM